MALLFFGGFIPALLYADARSYRVLCDRCGHIFRQPRLPKTGVAKFATTILVVHLLTATVAATLFWNPDLAALVPGTGLIDRLGLTASPVVKALAVLSLTTATTTAMACVIVAAASSLAQRARLSKRYELKAKRRSSAPNHPPRVSAEPVFEDGVRNGG